MSLGLQKALRLQLQKSQVWLWWQRCGHADLPFLSRPRPARAGGKEGNNHLQRRWIQSFPQAGRRPSHAHFNMAIQDASVKAGRQDKARHQAHKAGSSRSYLTCSAAMPRYASTLAVRRMMSINSVRLIGFAAKSSHPAAIHFSRSRSMAFAVRAMIVPAYCCSRNWRVAA